MASKARAASGAVLVVLGLASLGAAAALKWVVVPDQKQLPADTNTTRQYDGTAAVLLNAPAMLTGDMSKVMLSNIPVKAERNVKVLDTDGDAAEVRDSRTLTSADGQNIGKSEVTYAVDRKTLEAATNPPSDWQVTKQEGLTVSWPIGAEQHDYVGWVPDTQSTTPVKYVGKEERGGLDTYVYEATVAAAPIKDPAVLGSLPQSLPPQVLGQLLTVLPLPEPLKQQFAQLAPQIKSDVPLTYTYEATSKYWVEPDTGIVVDLDRREVRKVGLTIPNGPSIPPSIPVYDVTTSVTDASVADAANDAKDANDRIQLYGTTLPLILGILGVLLLAVGIVLLATSRRRPVETAGPVAPTES